MMSRGFTRQHLAEIQRLCSQSTNQQLTITNMVPANLHVHPNTTNRRRAAVLVPLCHCHGQASILFTLRTSEVGSHKGQVSFPGGHIEPNETPQQAAFREAYEELGEGLGTIHYIGHAQTIPAVTGTLVTPIIGFVERDVGDFSHLSPSAAEVEQVFIRSIEQLCQPGYRQSEQLSRGGMTMEFPVYGPDEGSLRIWGLTAMILHAVLENAILPSRQDNDQR